MTYARQRITVLYMKYDSEVNVRMPGVMKNYLSTIAKAQSTLLRPINTSDVVRELILDKMPDNIKAMMGEQQ